MSYSLLPIQPVVVPDFGETLGRAQAQRQQSQMNALAMMAQQREMDAQRRLDAGLPGLAGGLGSADATVRRNALTQLASLGPLGARMALPLLSKESENAWVDGATPGAPAAPAAPQTASRLPSGDDLDAAVRTVIGEAANQGPDGWRAVAGVIRNRASSGKSLRDVVLAPGQFEPWQTRRGELEAIDPNSPQYQQVRAVIAPVLAGVAPDPTGGATHFYSPSAQAALGRPAPAWAQGDGTRIGDHMFYRLGGAQPAAPSAQQDTLVAPGFDPGMVQRARIAAARGSEGAARFLAEHDRALALAQKADGQPARSPARFQQDLAIANASRPTTSVTTERTYGGLLAGKAVDAIDAARSAAQTGADAVGASQRVLDLLKGGAITGTGAEWRIGLDRALATAGLIDGERVANTEQLMTDLSKNVLAMSGQLRGPTSDRDIQFLQSAAAGRISLTPETMRRIARLGAEYGQRAISEYNAIVEPLQNDRDLPAAVRGVYRPITAPTPAAPAAPRQNGRDAQPEGDAGSDLSPTAMPQPADPMALARDAIARGAPRAAVIQRLRENGIDPAGL